MLRRARRLLVSLALFAAGVLAGILIQKVHLPGMALRWLSTGIISFKESVPFLSPKIITLRVRDAEETGQPEKLEKFCTEKVPSSQAALILIDVWAERPNDDWKKRKEINIRTKLLPLVEAARKHHILVIHSPHERRIHPLIRPCPDEIVVDGPGEQARLLRLLKQRRIKYLLYAGYATNMCLLNRPTGIIEMAKHNQKVIVVRDATLAVESPEFIPEELARKAAVHIVELNWGMSTTVDDVLEALGERK